MKNDMNDGLYPSVRNVYVKKEIEKKKCSLCEKEKELSMFRWNTVCIECEEAEIIVKEDEEEDELSLEFLVREAVGQSQNKLVEFLLYDDIIRGVDDIEWNDFGYEDSDDEDSDDDNEESENYAKYEALSCFSWFRLKEWYKDSFDYNKHKIPTYKFKGEVWVLNVNNFMKV